MLNFEGNKICGKKGFAFSQGKVIYWYEKSEKKFEDLVN